MECLLKPKSGIDDLKVYEPGRPLEEVARDYGLAPEELTKLASNENALGPSPLAVKAMQDAASSMHLYPDGGAFYLRDALAEQLSVDPDMVLFGNGSNELIEFLGHVFLGPGTNMVMSECAFVIYKLVADAFGAETRMAPMQDFTHDLSAMAALVDADTRLMFIANPNNPTGTCVSPATLKALHDELPGHVLLVVDEAYIELLPEADRPATLEWIKTSSNLMVMRTFSKAYGLAGLRLGYAVAQPTLIQLLNKFRQPFNVSAMAQVAALAAVADTAHVEKTREMVTQGLTFFREACAELDLETVPSVANFLLIRIGEGRRRFAELQAKGVIARPMDGYGLPDYLRVSVGTATENKTAMQAIREVLS